MDAKTLKIPRMTDRIIEKIVEEYDEFSTLIIDGYTDYFAICQKINGLSENMFKELYYKADKYFIKKMKQYKSASNLTSNELFYVKESIQYPTEFFDNYDTVYWWPDSDDFKALVEKNKKYLK